MRPVDFVTDYTNFWSGGKEEAKKRLPYETQLNQGIMEPYSVGSIVCYTYAPTVWGVVEEVFPAYNLVNVRWNGGYWKQHSVDEVQLVLQINDDVKKQIEGLSNFKKASIRNRIASVKNDPVLPYEDEFLGNPNNHGVAQSGPIDGGTDVMQKLLEKMRVEQKQVLKEVQKTAAYFKSKGRIYQRSKFEKAEDVCICPKCKEHMNLEPFTKGIKIWICPDCGWKISENNVL